MRSARPVVLLGVGVLLLAWWTGLEIAPRSSPVTAIFEEDQQESPVRASADVPEAPLPTRFEARAADVRDACDLDLDLRCDERACAGVLTAPDLDRLGGWLTFVFASPRFVLSTAARDLGVPPRVLPCGSAVEQLVGTSGVTAVELEDGTEVWCTTSGETAAGQALCDALAAEHGRPEVGFGATGLRRLTFDRR